jgi:hypothetical protein
MPGLRPVIVRVREPVAEALRTVAAVLVGLCLFVVMPAIPLLLLELVIRLVTGEWVLVGGEDCDPTRALC